MIKFTSAAGKIIGVFLGLFLNMPSVAVGLIIGHLFDLILKQWKFNHLIAKHYSLFESRMGSREKYFLAVLSLASLCAGNMDAASFAKIKKFLQGKIGRDYYSLVGYFLKKEKYQYSFFTNYGNIECFTLHFKNSAKQGEYLPFLDLLFSLIPDDHNRLYKIELVHTIARYLEVTEKQFALVSRRYLEKQNSSYYLLGVSPNSSLEDVRRAYYQLAVQFHPDTFYDLDEQQRQAGEQVFVRLKRAYDDVILRKTRCH